MVRLDDIILKLTQLREEHGNLLVGINDPCIDDIYNLRNLNDIRLTMTWNNGQNGVDKESWEDNREEFPEYPTFNPTHVVISYDP